MSSSRNYKEDDKDYHERRQLVTNEYVNLIIERMQTRYVRGGVKKKDINISGLMCRTFSELDLFELKRVVDAIEDH